MNITDEQVQTAINVLKAFAEGTLQTDLCDELDEAVEQAYNVLLREWVDQDRDFV